MALHINILSAENCTLTYRNGHRLTCLVKRPETALKAKMTAMTVIRWEAETMTDSVKLQKGIPTFPIFAELYLLCSPSLFIKK